jgi:superoxide reductase
MQETVQEFKGLFQSADWKTEKHVPVIEAPDKVKKGEMFTVRSLVGREIPHPNTTQHHIMWLDLYFHPAGEKFPYQIAHADFTAHGSSVQGADTSTVYTAPDVTVTFKTDKPGIIFSSSYCNIHGLWQGSKAIDVE